MSATSQFLARAAAAYDSKQGHVLAEILLPDLDDPAVEAMARELLQEHASIRATVLAALPHEGQARLADLMGTVLQYVCDATRADAAHAALLVALRVAKIYESATKMFALPDAGWFNPCVQTLTLALLESAAEADHAQEDNSTDRVVAAITIATNGPLKTAAADTKDPDAAAPRPRDIVFWLANLLLRHCFALRDTLASAEPILGFVAPQLPALPRYTKAEQTTFHYHAGSVFLAKEELRPAHAHLQRAFDLCTSRSPANKRRIFINLATAATLLGVFPTPALLAAFRLTPLFAPLLAALARGDRTAFRAHLDAHMPWFRARAIYLVLRAKGEVLVLRSLFRRTILVARRLWPPATAGEPPTLALAHLLAALRVAHRAPALGDLPLETWDVHDAEALCASLIDQGYIQGYLLHSRACLVVQKGPTLGFPPVAAVAVSNDP